MLSWNGRGEAWVTGIDDAGGEVQCSCSGCGGGCPLPPPLPPPCGCRYSGGGGDRYSAAVDGDTAPGEYARCCGGKCAGDGEGDKLNRRPVWGLAAVAYAGS